MANCFGRLTGEDANRVKEATRVGSSSMSADVQTWQTVATATVFKDGSGYVQVKTKNGGTIHRFDFGPEANRPDGVEVQLCEQCNTAPAVYTYVAWKLCGACFSTRFARIEKRAGV